MFADHFSFASTNVCPECSSQLQFRRGKHGVFLGCSRYPDCHFIKPTHQIDGHVIKPLATPCPKCARELLLKQGRYGMFIGCEGFPDCDFLTSATELADEGPSDNEGAECPECGKAHLVKRHNRFGKIFYGCENYPKCQFALNSQPILGRCIKCAGGLLIEKKRQNLNGYQCVNKDCNHWQMDKQ